MPSCHKKTSDLPVADPKGAKKPVAKAAHAAAAPTATTPTPSPANKAPVAPKTVAKRGVAKLKKVAEKKPTKVVKKPSPKKALDSVVDIPPSKTHASADGSSTTLVEQQEIHKPARTDAVAPHVALS